MSKILPVFYVIEDFFRGLLQTHNISADFFIFNIAVQATHFLESQGTVFECLVQFRISGGGRFGRWGLSGLGGAVCIRAGPLGSAAAQSHGQDKNGNGSGCRADEVRRAVQRETQCIQKPNRRRGVIGGDDGVGRVCRHRIRLCFLRLDGR